MRVCPKCGFRESPCWKRSFQHNPNGDIDVARIDMLMEWEKDIATQILDSRDSVVTDETFAYLLGSKARWVKRVEKSLYLQCGDSIFKVPYESGKPKLLVNQTKLLGKEERGRVHMHPTTEVEK